MLELANHPMTIDDVSDFRHGEREAHYLTSFGGQNIEDRLRVRHLAYNAATAEMLDEIHVMLRQLLKQTAK